MRSLCALVLLATPLAAQKAAVDYTHGTTVTALAFSPDGRTLASGGQDQTIRLWNLSTGQPRELRGHEASLSALAYSSDGKRLASAGRDGAILLWDATTGRLLRRFTGHERTVLGVAFSPSGRWVASASYDQTVRLWETATGKCLCEVQAHGDAVSCVGFSPDGKTLATGGHDALVKLWSIAADGKSLRAVHTLREARRAEVMGLGFCMSGRLLASVTPQGTIRLRDPIKGELIRTTSAENLTSLTLACSADGRTIATAGVGGAFTLCEVATGEPVARREEPSARTSYLEFSPLEGYVGQVRALALSSTGLVAALGTKEGAILVRDVGRLLLGRKSEMVDEKELQRIWNELSRPSASDGYRAAALLAAHPEVSVPFLKRQLKPVERPTPARVAKLLDQLDHPRYAVREKAAAELEKVLDVVEGDLRKRLTTRPSLETRRRIERLLEPLDELVPPPHRLRAGRALMALERLGTEPACEVLEGLARGCPDAWLTGEARLALARLRAAP
jgi:hypothetical protein